MPTVMIIVVIRVILITTIAIVTVIAILTMAESMVPPIVAPMQCMLIVPMLIALVMVITIAMVVVIPAAMAIGILHTVAFMLIPVLVMVLWGIVMTIDHPALRVIPLVSSMVHFMLMLVVFMVVAPSMTMGVMHLALHLILWCESRLLVQEFDSIKFIVGQLIASKLITGNLIASFKEVGDVNIVFALQIEELLYGFIVQKEIANGHL